MWSYLFLPSIRKLILLPRWHTGSLCQVNIIFWQVDITSSSRHYDNISYAITSYRWLIQVKDIKSTKFEQFVIENATKLVSPLTVNLLRPCGFEASQAENKWRFFHQDIPYRLSNLYGFIEYILLLNLCNNFSSLMFNNEVIDTCR